MMNNNICHPWWVHTVSHTSAERLAWCSCFWLTLTLVKFSIRLLRRNACKGLRVLTLFRFFGNFSVTSIRRCCKQYTERHEFLLSGLRWPEDVLPRLLSWFVLCRLFGEDCLKAGRCWEKPWVEGLAVYCQRSFSSCQFSSDFVTLHLFGLPVFGFWCLLVLYTSLMLLSRLLLRPGSFSGGEPCATAAARCRRLGNGAPSHREGSLHCRSVCFFLLRSQENPDLPRPPRTFPDLPRDHSFSALEGPAQDQWGMSGFLRSTLRIAPPLRGEGLVRERFAGAGSISWLATLQHIHRSCCMPLKFDHMT